MTSIKACNRHSHTYHIEDYVSETGSTIVRLFYREADTEQEQLIARFRNLTETTIFDKCFEPTQPSVPVNHGRWDAIKDLDNNWESYADEYKQHHGP